MIRTLLLTGLIALAAPAAVQAQTRSEGTFDLVLRGLTAGQLTFSGVENGRSYAVRGVLKSGGLVAMIRKVRYDAEVEGTVAGPRLSPARYREDADTGKRQSTSVMRWVRGVPQVESATPVRTPRPNDVDPATQKGTVDPLTALYATLRDVPAAEVCTTNVIMFDGRRRSELRLSAPVMQGERVTCSGEYRRIAGFSDKEMAEKVRFPFTLTYAPAGEGRMRVVEVAMDTLYGKATLKRR